jgi:amino acid transporter
MSKWAKRWLWSWAIAGLAAPFALLAVGHFLPPVPETGIFDKPPVLTLAQQRVDKASALLFPGQFVSGMLALAVTDAGGDSGTPVTGTIILIAGLLVNGALYEVIGLVLLALAKIIREISRGRYPTSGSGT